MDSSLLQLLELARLPLSEGTTVSMTGEDPVLPVAYRLGTAAAAVMGACGAAASELWALKGNKGQGVSVNRRSAAVALRAGRYLLTNGQHIARPPSVVGFYQVQDGRWIYLKDFKLDVLGVEKDRSAIGDAVAKWNGLELEEALHASGGCASFVRTEDEWRALPQADVVSSSPLFEITKIGDAPPEPLPSGGRQPLSGIRVLDLTHVMAGPVCTRTLAEHDADVLQIAHERMIKTDTDVGHGKRSAFLDFRSPDDIKTVHELASRADIVAQSYRPASLASRGLSPQDMARLRPGIVYVSLSAFGHRGPWKDRRGFDTVVQAANGMAYRPNGEAPLFLPASAQDYIAGYLMAFGAMAALNRRVTEGGSWLVQVSLAGVGEWIRDLGLLGASEFASVPADIPEAELKAMLIETVGPIGHLTHLAPVAKFSETPAQWRRPSVPNGHDAPGWLA